ncbi:hypothetical protein [Snodgrassella sp. ESL0324]|uniref:hypothetical protein n=1 Tax=Snodgrassella sp. ESL0324 TaxID=2705033 RepID=UPI001581A25C|nr:hypothetical protein [Snodgrassella sp. ESL0324]NUF09829.1 hypothetical protein [Snodgrassella sp. ESL0324]
MDTELEYICLRSSYLVGQAYYRLDLTNKLGYDEITWLNSPENLRDASLNVVFSEIREVQRVNQLIINHLYSNKEEFNFITEEPKDGEYVWVSDLLSPEFVSLIKYDSSWNPHRQLFKNHLVFVTEDLAVKASKSIIQILRREAARKRFKPLTKAPQDGTTVYLADVTSKYGYKSIVYTKEFEHLLNYRLLYPDIYEAIQASTAMRQLINPPIPDTTKKPEPDKQ